MVIFGTGLPNPRQVYQHAIYTEQKRTCQWSPSPSVSPQQMYYFSQNMDRPLTEQTVATI